MKMKNILFIVGISVLGTALIFFFQSNRTEALNPSHNGCATCHSLHGAPGQTLTNDLSVEVLCLSCHGPAGIATKKAEVHTNDTFSSYPAFRMTCMDCHNPHDDMENVYRGLNLLQVGKKLDSTGYAKISTPNSGIRDVVFESRGLDAGDPSLHSFADGDEDNNGTYDGSCEVCHTQTRFHRNNSSGIHRHQAGRTCTNCHSHTNYFNR